MATILILDDSQTLRLLVRTFLANDLDEFAEATTAEEGLAFCRNKPVDLVIADIGLPGMSGLDFVKTLRVDANPKLTALPVILLTGVRLRAEGMRAGANAFITKPVDRQKLRETVAEVMKRSL